VKEGKATLLSQDMFLWYIMNTGLGQPRNHPGCSDKKILNSTARNRTPATQFISRNKKQCMGQTECFIIITKDLTRYDIG